MFWGRCQISGALQRACEDYGVVRQQFNYFCDFIDVDISTFHFLNYNEVFLAVTSIEGRTRITPQ